MPSLPRTALILILVLAASGCVATEGTTVVDVADGDTLDVKFNGSVETVRLIGVDTPETFGKVNPGEFGVEDTEKGRECLSGWAGKASDRTKELEGKQVRLLHENQRGSYGRLLGYIYRENRSRSYNYFLVKQGYARVYDSRFSQRASFLEAQESAKAQEKGLWSCS